MALQYGRDVRLSPVGPRPVQWARQSAAGRQVENDGSRLVNFYATVAVTPEEAKVPVVIYGAPGFEQAISLSGVGDTFPVNGIIAIKSPIYGDHIYLLHGNAYITVIDVPRPASFPNGITINPKTRIAAGSPLSGNIRMATDGRHVLWVTPSEVWSWDQGADTPGMNAVRAPTPDDPGDDSHTENWVDAVWIDGYFILASQGGQIFHSNLYTTQFDQLDFARASSSPDRIVGLGTINRQLFVFGSETIERWYNAGTTDFAFRRDNSFVFNIGAVNVNTISTNEAAVIFVGSDLSVYFVGGSAVRRISTDAVDYDVARADLDSMKSWTYTEEGHKFYVLELTIERAAKQWCYDFATGFWHERSYRYTGVSCVRYRNHNLAVSRNNELAIYRIGLDYSGNMADVGGVQRALERTAISPIMHPNRKRAMVREFQLDVSYTPDSSDQSLALDLDYSDNGAESFMPAPPRRISGGARFKWTQLGQIKQVGGSSVLGRNFRIRTNSPGRIIVNGAYARLEDCKD